MYGALGGAFYPWVFKVVFRSPRDPYITFPGVLNSTQTYSMILFVLAGAVYLAAGAVGSVSGRLRQWGGLPATYIVYGLVLGFWFGLSYPVWYPLLGV